MSVRSNVSAPQSKHVAMRSSSSSAGSRTRQRAPHAHRTSYSCSATRSRYAEGETSAAGRLRRARHASRRPRTWRELGRSLYTGPPPRRWPGEPRDEDCRPGVAVAQWLCHEHDARSQRSSAAGRTVVSEGVAVEKRVPRTQGPPCRPHPRSNARRSAGDAPPHIPSVIPAAIA